MRRENREYIKLLEPYPPRAIHNDKEHRAALAVIDGLMRQDDKSDAMAALIETHAVLIEEYESDTEPPDVTPDRLLRHLMEAHDISQSNLAEVAGVSLLIISEIVQGVRGVSADVAKKLAAYFGVEVSLFDSPMQSTAGVEE